MNEFIVYDGDELIGYEYLLEDGRRVFVLKNEGIERLGTITEPYDRPLLRYPYIGKTDIEGNKIYADSSIVEFSTNDLGWQKGYFSYNENGLNYQFNSKDGALLTDWMEIKNLKIIGTLQENKELLDG